MRRYLGSLAFLSCLSAASAAMAATPASEETTASATVPVQQTRSPLPGVRDEAAMVLIGAALIGLAAAVRRAA